MPTGLIPDSGIFLADDAAALQQQLERWETPDAETLLHLVEQAEGKPHTTACLLSFLHAHFSAEEIARTRQLRQDKELGLLDWDTEDWAQTFRWEIAGGGCRILEYLGQDREVLIPEMLDGVPVREVARQFFFHARTVIRLLVPQDICVGTVAPREAALLFAQQPTSPEICILPREQPLPSLPNVSTPPLIIGDTVEFGRYACGAGGSTEPIRWQLLQREGDRALLVSERILERLPYHHHRTAVLWMDCDLRSWLQNIFLSAAFTPEEQARILPVLHEDGANPLFRTRNASRAEDAIFLLSPEEWETESHPQPQPELTPWAAGSGNAPPCPVWLRMPGLSTQYAVTLSAAQKIDYQGTLVNDHTIGVCPAMWVQL